MLVFILVQLQIELVDVEWRSVIVPRSAGLRLFGLRLSKEGFFPLWRLGLVYSLEHGKCGASVTVVHIALAVECFVLRWLFLFYFEIVIGA